MCVCQRCIFKNHTKRALGTQGPGEDKNNLYYTFGICGNGVRIRVQLESCPFGDYPYKRVWRSKAYHPPNIHVEVSILATSALRKLRLQNGIVCRSVCVQCVWGSPMVKPIRWAKDASWIWCANSFMLKLCNVKRRLWHNEEN